MLAGVLLVRCLDHAEGQDESAEAEIDFGLLGQLAFGRKGQAGINCVFALELWLATVIFFVLIGINTKFVFGLEPWLSIVVSGLLTFGLFYIPMRVLAFLSLISVLFMGLLLAVLVYSGESMPMHADQIEQLVWVNWAGSGQALGVFLLCFAGAPCIPSIYSAARDKRRFPVALILSCILAMLYYAACGALGYMFYGSQINQSFTVNLGLALDGSGLKGGEVLPLIAAVGLLVKLQATMPVIVSPVLVALGWKGVVLKILYIALTSAVAIGLSEYVDAAMSITGLSATVTSAVLFPIVVYIKLCKPPLVARLSLGLICTLAATVAVIGSVQTAIGLVNKEAFSAGMS
ncbi:unnamed protein product [Prorocentrum cordatum]|uniref:Amino acid transporter transmembrane domain-containing protein n=1 Tax=Prorocentrum cordatum TaxID=2364126 RepID=A0ABN9T5B7_9DINO|nr:unnamed protein product [Polarella glacialis]